ncbi:MAG: hypothetical protein JRG74_05245 [Deltaproteobacteria bacterium]|nr:hypothetical protein [Deltaproteobacteria bacterium]
MASKIVDFEQARHKQSQRQFAIEQGVCRSTLQHWLARKESIDASPILIEFLPILYSLRMEWQVFTTSVPYNTETGAKQDSQKVSELLESCFENINEATKDLSD